MLLVLRFIAQSEIATLDDLVEGLRFSRRQTTSAVLSALRRGWVEEVEGGYRLSWAKYGDVCRVLARKNLIPETRLESLKLGQIGGLA